MLAALRPAGAAAADRPLRRELGATLALGWPIILANLAINAMTATDFMMLGRLSPQALAAGSLGFFLYQPPFLLGLGVVGALSPIAAAKIGAGLSRDALRRATHQALISAILFAVVVWVILIGATPFLLAIGEPAEVARDAGVYLRGFQWGLAPSLLYFTGRVGVFGARTSAASAARGPRGGRVQRSCQLRADLRQAWRAGPGDHRLGPCHDARPRR